MSRDSGRIRPGKENDPWNTIFEERSGRIAGGNSPEPENKGADMRTLVSALCLVLVLPAVAKAATLPEFDIAAICKKTAQFASGSATVEQMCREQEQAAKQALQTSHAPQDVIDRCANTATITGQGYSIMQMCVTQELESLAKLQQPVMKPEPKQQSGLVPLLDFSSFCDSMAYYARGVDPAQARTDCMRRENEALAWFQTDPGFSPADLNACNTLIKATASYAILRNCLESRISSPK